MRDPKRIPHIAGLLEQVWCREPDTRFGQLLVNIGYLNVRSSIGMVDDPFYYEDEKLEHCLLEYLNPTDKKED